ncbi:hypothetical protein WS83_20735 [Burkholderia sp. MSMB2042]|nr:hypothetical protein WS78_26960 [Burkholderia savannae]KVG46311.1 hypothetical protein WS77_31735 [Burkholderia sp. MSMB0265]KVG95791.1 hypothetical protein WS82_04105 [Burkholderia sp. MSMB2041]KVH00777.1 hypothetical protein WS83_20735 [Burkholderia sp. MSMB2042]
MSGSGNERTPRDAASGVGHRASCGSFGLRGSAAAMLAVMRRRRTAPQCNAVTPCKALPQRCRRDKRAINAPPRDAPRRPYRATSVQSTIEAVT